MMSDNTRIASLGSRLRDARLERNESQEIFAARIGVSVPTIRRMEAGDPKVAIGYWAAALKILDRDLDLDSVLAPKEDLFAKFDTLHTPKRKRAWRKHQ